MIHLFYFTNMTRRIVGEVALEDLLNDTDMIESLYREFEKAGVKVDREKGHLCIKEETGFIPFDLDAVLHQNDITVAYCNVIAPNNAYEFGRENGIIYFFHTEENNHLYDPHIHAKTPGGEEIRISLKNFSTKGKFKNPNKQKEAIQYVKRDITAIKEEWNRIMKSLGGPIWDD